MPWNEPGGNQKDPWGKRPAEKGPPNLDELLRKFTGRFGGLLGGKSGSGNGKSGSIGLILLLLVAVIVWLATGFYTVGSDERGVVLRFGKYEGLTEAGLHWRFPYPVDAIEIVNVENVRTSQTKTRMLTQDENIVEVEVAVQYRVKDAADYVFNVRNPDDTTNQSAGTLFQVMESALRQSVGKNKIDFILFEGRAEVAANTKSLMQKTLDEYKTGLDVTTVNLQQAQPPEDVQSAFDDVTKSREDNVRFVNLAEAYANSIVPQARGEAARLMQEAEAYKEQVIAESVGETSRFSQLLVEYEKAPDVTRQRLYLQSMESVLGRSSKVVIDAEGGNSLMYLPLDKLIQKQDLSGQSSTQQEMTGSSGQSPNTRSERSGRTGTREGR